MKTILFFLSLFFATTLVSQVHDDKNYCKINCDPEIDKEHGDIFSQLENDLIQQLLENVDTLKFPLRFVFVQQENFIPTKSTEDSLASVIEKLNYAFKNTAISFYLHQIDTITSALKIEDLSQNQNNLYDKFSAKNDLSDLISVYILDHKKEFCTISNTSISCSRTGGFSYILSSRTNNLVISQFDLKDPKIVVHEFGHFFGLHHTFEEQLFGKDTYDQNLCTTLGDRICDTPPDPGPAFEIYVNYSICEMSGFKDNNGMEYKPLLENYMSYYKPCYLKEYSFTEQQEIILNLASQLSIRKKLSK